MHIKIYILVQIYCKFIYSYNFAHEIFMQKISYQ